MGPISATRQVSRKHRRSLTSFGVFEDGVASLAKNSIEPIIVYIYIYIDDRC